MGMPVYDIINLSQVVTNKMVMKQKLSRRFSRFVFN